MTREEAQQIVDHFDNHQPVYKLIVLDDSTTALLVEAKALQTAEELETLFNS